MKLLQIPTDQLEQRIKEELEANPALEESAEFEQETDDIFQDKEEKEEGKTAIPAMSWT